LSIGRLSCPLIFVNVTMLCSSFNLQFLHKLLVYFLVCSKLWSERRLKPFWNDELDFNDVIIIIYLLVDCPVCELFILPIISSYRILVFRSIHVTSIFTLTFSFHSCHFDFQVLLENYHTRSGSIPVTLAHWPHHVCCLLLSSCISDEVINIPHVLFDYLLHAYLYAWNSRLSFFSCFTFSFPSLAFITQVCCAQELNYFMDAYKLQYVHIKQSTYFLYPIVIHPLGNTFPFRNPSFVYFNLVLLLVDQIFIYYVFNVFISQWSLHLILLLPWTMC
jgi:hypothetical protein